MKEARGEYRTVPFEEPAPAVPESEPEGGDPGSESGE